MKFRSKWFVLCYFEIVSHSPQEAFWSKPFLKCSLPSKFLKEPNVQKFSLWISKGSKDVHDRDDTTFEYKLIQNVWYIYNSKLYIYTAKAFSDIGKATKHLSKHKKCIHFVQFTISLAPVTLRLIWYFNMRNVFCIFPLCSF